MSLRKRTGGPWRAALPPAALSFFFYCYTVRNAASPNQLVLEGALLLSALISAVLSFAFFRRHQTASRLCAALYLAVQTARNGRAASALWGTPAPWPYSDFIALKALLIFVALGVFLWTICQKRIEWILLGMACVGAGLTLGMMIKSFSWLRFTPACQFFEFLVPASGLLWKSWHEAGERGEEGKTEKGGRADGADCR